MVQATWRGVYPALVSESSSAPLDAKIAATLTRSSWAHKCIGASPFLALAFGSAPFLRRRLVISIWPSWAAKWRGVKPAFDSASVFAPNCRRLFAMSSWFFLAVICRGVYPFLAAAWGDASCKVKNSKNIRIQISDGYFVISNCYNWISYIIYHKLNYFTVYFWRNLILRISKSSVLFHKTFHRTQNCMTYIFILLWLIHYGIDL